MKPGYLNRAQRATAARRPAALHVAGRFGAEALYQAEEIALIRDRHDFAAVDDHCLAHQSSLDSLARQQPEQQRERAPSGW
jgi:hypothetical protein